MNQVSSNEIHRVINFMGDPGHKLPKARHLFALDELCLRLLEFFEGLLEFDGLALGLLEEFGLLKGDAQLGSHLREKTSFFRLPHPRVRMLIGYQQSPQRLAL